MMACMTVEAGVQGEVGFVVPLGLSPVFAELLGRHWFEALQGRRKGGV